MEKGTKQFTKMVVERGTGSLLSDTDLPITKQHFVLILYTRDGMREKEKKITKWTILKSINQYASTLYTATVTTKAYVSILRRVFDHLSHDQARTVFTQACLSHDHIYSNIVKYSHKHACHRITYIVQYSHKYACHMITYRAHKHRVFCHLPHHHTNT